MKIVEIILDLSNRAGAEIFFEALCFELSKKDDVELTIISLWDSIHPSFEAIREFKNVRFYTLGKKKGVDFKAAKKLKRIINEIDPDIIHTHRSILLTYFLAFGLKRCNWKIVHTIHNIPSKESNGITNLLRKMYIKRKAIYFVGISDIITHLFSERFPMADIVTIFNGINLRRPQIRNSKKYTFINVARFSEQKNHKLLFDSFEEIAREDKSISLVCLGTGELFEFYSDYVSKLDTQNRITLVGSVDDVYPFLCESCCFVLSSIYEGNPISVLEAMECGLPVIAPTVGGIPDVIKDGQNGLLYGVNDGKRLVSCMKKIIYMNDLYKKISNRNKIDVEHFSIEHCSEEYLKLFLSIINRTEEKK